MLRLTTQSSPVTQLRDELDRFFVDAFSPRSAGLQISGRRNHPAFDIWEENDRFFVEAELPGFAKSEIDITAVGRKLEVSASPSSDKVDTADTSNGEGVSDADVVGRNYHHRERTPGTFQRAILFPVDIDVDNVTADFRNGLLTVTVSKSASSQPRKVSVNSN